MKVGCFEVEPLTSGRWKVTNTLTTFSHVTYGSEQEVTEQAQLQTAAWERKVNPADKAKGRGAAWRRTMVGNDIRAKAAEKTAS